MAMNFKGFLFFIAPIISGSYGSILEARLDGGIVRGDFCSGSDSSSQFLGIPYAIPPVGQRRWEAPSPFNSTFGSENGVLNATRHPAVCHQFGPGEAIEPGPYDEDCLYLNVWVPEGVNSRDSPSLPVKVWIHGGANIGGSIANPQYNGCKLSEEGSIVVSIAYRLGPLGFLALESAGISGNFGIQDILLGLQWVQDNIGKFGGDKNKVLLFGQSAGAWNCWIISTLPSAPNLMRAVAMQSGGGVDFQTNSSAQLGGAAFARNANCSTTDITCLRRLTPKQLNDVYSVPGSPALTGYNINRPSVQPFIDGKVIPMQPSQVGSRVPAVFSTTSEEGAFFVVLTEPDPTNINEEGFNNFLRSEFGPLSDLVNAKYPISDFEGLPMPKFSRASQIITDYAWKCPAYRGLTRTAERGVPAWTYIFDHVLTCPFAESLTPTIRDLMGAGHGFDIPYTFAHTDELPLPNGNCSLNEEEERTSDIIVDAWSSLATTGNASTSDFEWPSFTNGSYMGLSIGRNSTEITSFTSNYSICIFWNQINALLLEAANTNSTNVTAEIPSNPTITDGSLGSAIPTQTQPSEGSLVDVGMITVSIALLIGSLLIGTL
ncbi:hypothetical protein TWF730_008467 [Orbilia blumenaviensis]|uniref:Carboxylic ester hydrolase n=1 Tax=Orbilia blumenaviensis TaxID=1796055 RepID=A0AAV9V533_9PEZI